MVNKTLDDHIQVIILKLWEYASLSAYQLFVKSSFKMGRLYEHAQHVQAKKINKPIPIYRFVKIEIIRHLMLNDT